MAPEQTTILELITYDPDTYVKYDTLPAELLCERITPGKVNWVNVDGLVDSTTMEKLQRHFDLHSLLIEDVLDDQRPKIEEYDKYLFFTMKMLYRIDGNNIEYEQLSLVLGDDYLVSLQQKAGDLFDGFRERIRADQGRVRKRKGDYLMYRLIDIAVDKYYNVLDNIGEQIEEIEDNIYSNPSTENFKKIQAIRKELIFLRKALNPLRDALGTINKNEFDLIHDINLPFFADVYDHVVHLIDMLDAYKDLTAAVMDIHMNSLNTRMNEVMKVLTVISTIFMPLTFIVGVYGMNFRVMPELEWKYGYVLVWGVMITLFIFMIRYFRRKKWF